MENFWQPILDWIWQVGPRILWALVTFVVGWYLSKLVVKLLKRAMERGRAEKGAVTFISSVVSILLKLLVAITAAAQLGMDVTSIIAAVGTMGVAVGLAIKDSMSNVASGVQILFTHPFRAGDYLVTEGVECTVERIEIMYTSLRTFDNKEVIIPNSELTTNIITNFSAQKTRRLDLNYSVSYSTDLAQARQVLEEVVAANEKILQDPAPLIAVGEHQDSAILMVVKVWCDTDDYWPLYYEMQEKVKNAFDEAGIEIPFPQIDVHMR